MRQSAELGPEPPWRLSGRGYVLLLRLPGARPLQRWCRMLMVMDYQRSPIGPYWEILDIPGRRRFGGRWHWSIARIYVSTARSVVAGRTYWGIPKEQADFESTRDGSGERLCITHGGVVVADLRFAARGPAFPTTAAIIPPRLRTLAQPLGGQLHFIAPTGRARVRRARLLHAHVEEQSFMPFAPSDALLGFHLKRFEITFPRARVTPWRAS